MRPRKCVTVVSQRKEWDCGVAALAMLTGRSYGDVMVVVRAMVNERKLRRYGLVLHEVETVAGALGYPLRRRYRSAGYLDDRPTGILGWLGGTMDPRGHWTVLKAGAIVEPDGGEVWSMHDYLKVTKARPCTLLVAEF